MYVRKTLYFPAAGHEKPLIYVRKTYIINKRPIFGDGHRIIDNVPDGEGSHSGSSGGGSSGSGELSESSKLPITPITDKAIERVPNVSISDYTDKQCAFIQQQHKELLKYARDNNGNKEVAFVFDGKLKSRKEFKGTDDKLDFGSALYGKDLFVMHNHPRNSSYSDTDIAFLLKSDNVKTLTIVKNNGSVEVLTKTKNFNKEKAITAFKREYKKYVKSGTDKEIDNAVNHFIVSGIGGLQWMKR